MDVGTQWQLANNFMQDNMSLRLNDRSVNMMSSCLPTVGDVSAVCI